MTLFMTQGWELFEGGGLLAIASAYAMLAVCLTEYLLRRRQLAIPAGITAALAVAMVPLAVYGLQRLIGLWPPVELDADTYRAFHERIDGRWVVMELATLLAGSIALLRYRLPFLVMPLAITLWYMSMDLVPFFFDGPDEFFSPRGRWISLAFGAAMLLSAVYVDLRTRHTKDYAFWLYIVGTLTFWGSLSSLGTGDAFGFNVYLLVNLSLIAAGAVLSRRVLVVFGGLGIAGYLGHLSHTVFNDSLLFPVALTGVGLAIVACGVFWQRNEKAIGERLRSGLPRAVSELVDARAA
jgi:hypothetical protein